MPHCTLHPLARSTLRAGLTAALLLAAAGCAGPSLGPRSIPTARLDYNLAISRSWDEQILLNLVRLRYVESPLFVDVNGITAAYSAGGSASLGAKFAQGSHTETTLGLGFDLRDNPVVTYSYLQGEQYARRILSPITVDVMEPLTRSGWSLERLLRCCVQSINGIENDVVDQARFASVVELLSRLQAARQVRLARDADGRVYLQMRRADDTSAALNAALGLPAAATRTEVIDAVTPLPGKISIQGRSLLAAMYVLAYAVEVPQEDAGRVPRLVDAQGRPVDAAAVIGSALRVRSGPAAPGDAAVAVPARGRWYWIDDLDLDSKNTLALLRMLLFLKSAETASAAPVVTIPSR
jgi:hypothetical protein